MKNRPIGTTARTSFPTAHMNQARFHQNFPVGVLKRLETDECEVRNLVIVQWSAMFQHPQDSLHRRTVNGDLTHDSSKNGMDFLISVSSETACRRRFCLTQAESVTPKSAAHISKARFSSLATRILIVIVRMDYSVGQTCPHVNTGVSACKHK